MPAVTTAGPGVTGRPSGGKQLVAVVLVELPGREGIVRREDGEIVVCRDVGTPGVGDTPREGDRFLPVKTWLDGGRWLVGGLLPPTAERVEVVDDRGVRVAAAVGDGVYAAVIDRFNNWYEPIVCCRDGAGAPVRRPVPEDYPRTLVTDAEEPCPACGAIDYEECVPTESWRGGRVGPDGETIPSPIVVCRRCGQEQPEGVISRFASPEGEDEQARTERVARWRAEQRVQEWYRHKIVLTAVTFPIYAAQGWPAQINGSGSSGDDLTELTIAHTDTPAADLLDERPRIQVTTSTEAPRRGEPAIARGVLEHWVRDEIDHPHSDDLSDAAITLWFRAVDRLQRSAAANAARSEAQIMIDGAAAPFVTLTTPSGRWVAARRHAGLTVTIAARDVDPGSLLLEPLADPAESLLGPEPDVP
jgi:hypothetical protein